MPVILRVNNNVSEGIIFQLRLGFIDTKLVNMYAYIAGNPFYTSQKIHSHQRRLYLPVRLAALISLIIH